ncbi:MAG: hypothetical protein Q8R69_25625 [Telluria sp.]|nr:hypothetical protein [Telluria sp.]
MKQKLAPGPADRDLRRLRVRVRVLLGLAVLLLGTGLVNAFGHVWLPNNDRGYLHLVAAGFCLYLFIECRRHVLRSDNFGLLAPPLLASIMFGFLSFILPVTASLHDAEIITRFDPLFFEPDERISEALLLVCFAIFCMWRGYDWSLPFARRVAVRVKHTSFLREAWTPRMLPLLVLQAIYVAAAIVRIDLGVFGIASSTEAMERNLHLLDLLSLGMSGGSLSLLLLLVAYFRRMGNRQPAYGLGVLCAVLITIHVGFGVLSGFKSQMVAPFIMLVIAHFLGMGRVSVVFAATAVTALLAAYLVIEPYRAYLGLEDLKGEADVGTLAGAVQYSTRERASLSSSSDPLTTQIAARFDLTLMTALGTQAADDGSVDDYLIRQMEESIYRAPALAFIPRFIWPTKGSYSTGVWFNQIVLGNQWNQSTSVGMGPVAYLYFLGGLFAVVAGFLIIGFLQAILFAGIARVGAGGVIIYLATMSTLVMLPGDVGPALTGMLRIIAIAFIGQLVLLTPGARSAHPASAPARPAAAPGRSLK